MSSSHSYPLHARSTANRLRGRATYDFSTIHSIVNTTSILHVSFLPTDPSIDPFPTTLPMIGHMGSFTTPAADPSTESLDLYIHGSSAARLMQLPSAPSAPPQGIPVCVAATLLDGIVLALTPFHNSCNYRSAVLHGYAAPVTDEAEKAFALQLITDGLVPGRWAASRVPPTNAEMQSTAVLKITVESASAKVRVGGPGDDRKDLKDEELVGRVWTGVVPVWECLGEPQVAEKNGVPEVPAYLGQWREERNEAAEQYSRNAVSTKK